MNLLFSHIIILGCRITVITSDFGPDYGGSIPLGPTKYRKIFFKILMKIWIYKKYKLYLNRQMEIQIPNDLIEIFDILRQQKMKFK